MSLIETLSERDDNGPSYNEKWVQFIEDRFIQIRDRSEKQDISLETMARYQYRPEDYLLSLNKRPSLSWIMLLINQLPSRVDFFQLDSILIPSAEYIDEIKEVFDSIKDTVEMVDLTSTEN